MSLAEDLALSETQAAAAAAAIETVLESEDARGPRARRLLEIVRRELTIGGVAFPASSGDVARAVRTAFPSRASRRVLVDVLVIAACIECDVSLAGETAVLSLAGELEVRSPWADLLPALRRRSVRTVQLALARRAPDAKRVLSRTISERGVLGLVEIVSFVAGLHRDAELAARYRALADAPLGTLGRELFDDFVARGLTFPGEKGGLPERMIHHDLMHVLNGYGTDPAGECELAGFYAGFGSRFEIDGWFTFFVIALATFHLDMPVSPAVVLPAHGAFDPDRVLESFRRGRRLRVDVMGAWDHWPLMRLPISEARRTVGLLSE